MKKKIYFIATIYDPIHIFLKPYINNLQNEYEIIIICNLENNFFKKSKYFKYIHLNLPRNPNFVLDTVSFFRLIIIFIFNRPYKIISITPKSGFLCTLISRILFIDNIHFITGQVWQTNTKILYRKFLKFIDKIIGNFSHKVIVDSKPQYKYLFKNKIVNHRANFFNSVSGIDLQSIKKNNFKKELFKKGYNIHKNSFGLIYVGRINHDKGINDLIEIYLNLKKKLKNKIYLIIVGEDEINFFRQNLSSILKKNQIFYFQKSDNINYYLNLCDLFVTCSKREGFCQSIIEANAHGLPAIAYNLYNLSETILDKKTGYLAENKSIFIKHILNLYYNRLLYNKFSRNCLRRCKFDFNQNIFIKKFRSILFENV